MLEHADQDEDGDDGLRAQDNGDVHGGGRLGLGRGGVPRRGILNTPEGGPSRILVLAQAARLLGCAVQP